MLLKEFYIRLGKRIKKIREEKGYTQEVLAAKAGISVDYLGKIEVNINNPGLKSLFSIIKALDVTFEEFFKDF